MGDSRPLKVAWFEVGRFGFLQAPQGHVFLHPNLLTGMAQGSRLWLAETDDGDVASIHVSDLMPLRPLEVGDEVEGEVLQTQRGPRMVKARCTGSKLTNEGATSDEHNG